MSDTTTNTPEREAGPAPTKPARPPWYDEMLDGPGDDQDPDPEEETP
jgi:hypothetical protein